MTYLLGEQRFKRGPALIRLNGGKNAKRTHSRKNLSTGF